MKRNLLKRGLALITCAAVCMTSVPNIAFAAETAVGTEAETFGFQGESGENTTTEFDTEEEVGEIKLQTQSETETESQTETESSSETETESETGVTTESESESETETESKEIKTADARVKIAWSDFENLANRRDDSYPSEFLTVYADGEPMAVQPEIILESEFPEESYGIEFYTYVIKGLPLTREDGATTISYTVRETVPKGYTSFSDRAFNNADAAGQAIIMEKIAAPEHGVELKLKEDESGYEGEKTFGNYLPAYQAEGFVLWKGNETDGQRPDMESYFKNQFTILKNIDSENYTTFKIHYTQDENDDHRWNYVIEGLFTTAADGNDVTYQIQPGNVDGYELHIENSEISGDWTDIEVIYDGGCCSECFCWKKTRWQFSQRNIQNRYFQYFGLIMISRYVRQ